MSVFAYAGEQLVTTEVGLLLACRPARMCPDGVEREFIRVLDRKGKHVGTWHRHDDRAFAMVEVHGRAVTVDPPTVEALVARCAA